MTATSRRRVTTWWFESRTSRRFFFLYPTTVLRWVSLLASGRPASRNFAAFLKPRTPRGIEGLSIFSGHSPSVLPATIPRVQLLSAASRLSQPSIFLSFFFSPSPPPPIGFLCCTWKRKAVGSCSFLSFFLPPVAISRFFRVPIPMLSYGRARARAMAHPVHNETHTWILSGPLGRGRDDRRV